MSGLNERMGSGKPNFAIKALLHSRTMVEKEGYVATGVLAHAEGEMMEVELTEFKNFELGEPVSLTIYSPVGIQRLQSTIIAKAEGSIAVIFPLRSLSGLDEKRESPRIDIEARGTISRTYSQEVEDSKGNKMTIEATDSFDIELRNISDTGIGFSLMSPPTLAQGEILQASLALGFQLDCKVEIIRKDDGNEWKFYGARFQELDEQQQRALRAYLLRMQIEAYFKLKKEKSTAKKGR
ncbi:PilZ domain-containing protein [Paenibacillus sp. CF384]|uniref:PilZ domain-containing protein n=1 Tax=Paenibacillus sp. CF384 TaxID=1884382 RepID=UPI000894E99D|nr:PilZ domain-containing protein [Paenibacillus sp. CF384]SDX66701.1 c-di-GMP-binding flagellar brake protein YcgR, contains PilZNR and PilZ domains [Paenibacillus sp. CF384]